MIKKEFLVGKTKVGGNNPCFIVAEIGINFDSKFDQAIKLIDVAKKARCSAVKFQMFTAERMYVQSAGKYETATGEKRDIVDIVKAGELPPEWVVRLKKYANDNGLEFFATACDEHSADILERYDIPAYKIASYEITHLPLLRHIAKKKKPIIISSAGATIQEVADALDIFRQENNTDIILNHCYADYPAKLNKINLGVITTFKYAFPDVIVGYSDHTSEPANAPVAAIALGAKLIEKHITLDRNLPGPDHSFAVNPKELSRMVVEIRKTEKRLKAGEHIPVSTKILGTSARKTYPDETAVRNFAYRCLFAKKDIRKGERFSRKNLIVLRPGEARRGLDPKYYEILVKGFRATRKITKNQSVFWNDLFL